MYQAVIVDDEKEILDSTKAMLADSFNNHNVQVAFDFFTNSEDFLAMLEQHFHYDILFLYMMAYFQLNLIYTLTSLFQTYIS